MSQPLFPQVAIVTPFNFPFEIPVLQLMGALYMGNKPVLKVDSKVTYARGLNTGRQKLQSAATFRIIAHGSKWLLSAGCIHYSGCKYSVRMNYFVCVGQLSYGTDDAAASSLWNARGRCRLHKF